MIVVALDRPVNPAGRGPVERRIQRFLGPGLPRRAGDADHPRVAPRPRRPAEGIERFARVGDAHMRLRDCFGHDRPGGAGGEGQVDEPVTVGRLPLHRDEQVARTDLARIEGHAAGREGALDSAAGRGRNLGGGP
jgi:hypothetical protein